MLILLVFASLFVTVCLLNVLLAIIPSLAVGFNRYFYGSGILGFAVLAVVIAMPLVAQASSTEQALRLEDNLNKVYEANLGRK